MKPVRLLLTAAVLAGLMPAFSASVAHAGASTVEPGCLATRMGYTCFYGPYEVGPAGLEKTTMVPAPDEAGYLTYARATLVDRRNDPLSRHMVHLHHAVWANMSEDDLTCSYSPGERFFASGKERTAMDLPDGYGYFWGNETSSYGDGWGMTTHLMGMHGMTHRGVFIRLRMGFEPSTATLTPTRALWLDVNGSCTLDPTFDVAKGSGVKGRFKFRDTLTAPVSGRLIGAAGHLHDGGIRLSLRNTTVGKKVFTSRAEYEDDQRWFLTGMTSWYGTPGKRITAGDQLRLTSVYDSSRRREDAMGIMLGAFVPDE